MLSERLDRLPRRPCRWSPRTFAEIANRFYRNLFDNHPELLDECSTGVTRWTARSSRRSQGLHPHPKTVALAEVIERLGKVADGLSATPEPPVVELLPDWSVKRLTHQVGLAPDAVARMNLQEADLLPVDGLRNPCAAVATQPAMPSRATPKADSSDTEAVPHLALRDEPGCLHHRTEASPHVVRVQGVPTAEANIRLCSWHSRPDNGA